MFSKYVLRTFREFARSRKITCNYWSDKTYVFRFWSVNLRSKIMFTIGVIIIMSTYYILCLKVALIVGKAGESRRRPLVRWKNDLKNVADFTRQGKWRSGSPCTRRRPWISSSGLQRAELISYKAADFYSHNKIMSYQQLSYSYISMTKSVISI